MKKALRNEKGLTLVELLAVITIMTFIIVAISTVQFQFLNTHQEIQTGSFQNDETSFFIQFFTKQVRDTDHIDTTDANKVILQQDTEQAEFVYSSTDKTITYKKGAQSMVLLKNVEQFQHLIPVPSDRKGIELIIKVKIGKRIEEFRVKAYSFIGTRG